MSKAIIILLFLGIGDFPAGASQRQEFTRPMMGTQARIVLYSQDEAQGKKAAETAFARMAVLNQLMSDYVEDSELNRLSRRAGGPPVPVSPELWEVLSYGQEVAQRSDGAFDMTIGPLVQLWRRSRRQKQLPDPQTLAKAKAKVGYRLLKLDPAHHTAQLLEPGMKLDLGGIAKGYAADEALKVLRQQGVHQALVAIGGDIVVGDAPPGSAGWVIQIAPLRPGTDKPVAPLLLANAAVSTSGDAEQYVEIDGKRYSHIVDPRTGLGLQQRSSVTVVAPRGMLADAWTKPVCVLGVERGMALLDTIPGVAATATVLLPSEVRQEHFSQRWHKVPRKTD